MSDMGAMILKLFREGMEPSAIDRALLLAAGTSHDAIVAEWARDAEAWRKARRAADDDEA